MPRGHRLPLRRTETLAFQHLSFAPLKGVRAHLPRSFSKNSAVETMSVPMSCAPQTSMAPICAMQLAALLCRWAMFHFQASKEAFAKRIMSI